MAKLVALLFALVFLFFSGKTQDSLYKFGPDSQRKAGVPAGTVIKYEWQSKIYNNFREYYVYVPTQYDPGKPAALMIFQDGQAFVSDSGNQRVTIVYDNLISQKKLPVTICLFINPGFTIRESSGNKFRESNRADEYDVLDDRYATMLMDEIIPELKKNIISATMQKCMALAEFPAEASVHLPPHGNTLNISIKC